MAFYLFLILTLGLVIILCILNDSTCMLKPISRNENQFPKSVNLKYFNNKANLLNYNQSKNILRNYSNSEEVQNHIYIDELNTENTKPKRLYDNYSKTKIPAELMKVQNNLGYALHYKGSDPKNKNKKFSILNFDDDTDSDDYKTLYRIHTDNRNENVESGSGDGSQFMKLYDSNKNKNGNYDLETRKFIKRIGLKLLQLSKRNTSDSSFAYNKEPIKFAAKYRNNKRNKKLLRPATLESKISYYRSMELTTFNPLFKFKNFSKLSLESGSFPFWMATQIKTRRVISNEKKSDERSRQLLLCEKGKSSASGGELCRMLFKET